VTHTTFTHVTVPLFCAFFYIKTRASNYVVIPLQYESGQISMESSDNVILKYLLVLLKQPAV